MADEEDDYADSVDEEFLEIDSPMEPRPDIGDEDDELQEGANMLGPSATSSAAATAPPAASSKVKVRKVEDRTKMMEYPNSLPYECESIEEFDERLAFIHQRLIECIRTKDYDIGLVQWNHKLQCLISLKYPILRSTRASLANLYYQMVFIPGLDVRLIELCATMAITLLEPRRKINIKDLTLPWRPLYELLSSHLFPKSRATGLTGLSNTLMDLAGTAQRFFPPSEADAMLEEMLPRLDGSSFNSVIAVQAYLVHFLPLSKPQRWLPAMFKLWDCFESSLFDDQMLDLLARLAILHANPEISQSEESGAASPQRGLWREVGLLTKEQFAMVMTKALRSAGLPVGASKDANNALMAQSAGMRAGADSDASPTILSMKKPSSRIASFATIIVYSVMLDGPELPASGESTPVNAESAGNEQTSFLAGSRALDALSRFIQATETYFHPSNWGPWQYVLSAFVAELSIFFVNRWLDEHRSDCKTPKERRLTPAMKREFVQSVRNVCLMTMFSKDMFSVMACQKSLKRLAYLEPELILPAVLERAYPGLQELEMTHRTTAIIASLSTLALPLVSRQNFAAGGKHLVPLLQLCLPAIDPTDFVKTMGGCAFIFNAMMTVRIDDFTRPELSDGSEAEAGMDVDGDAAAARREEDDALRMSTAGAEEWAIEFFRRIFAVFDSLPEEGAKGKVGGKQEEHVSSSLLSSVDAVAASMSPHLAGLAWDVVYRYCSETVSASSSRLMGSVILSFARMHPEMVLSKMIPMASTRLRSEIQHGASSTRTTSTHTPAPGDATFHWHLSCLIGAVSGVGAHLVKYKAELMDLLALLVDRTRSERGYSLLSRLVQRILNTLVTLYPLEWRPLNPEEWDDPEAHKKAHLQWGKLYEAKDVKLTWHQPSPEEIAMGLEVVERFVQPALEDLNTLQDVPQEGRDKAWSNDFCRKMMLVKHAFSSLATLVQDDNDDATPSGQVASDAGDECMAFIAPPPRFKSGFILTDKSSPEYAAVRSFRARVGEVLYRCATSSKASEAEDKQDCIKLLLRSIRTYLTDYAYNSEDYHGHSRSLSYYRSVFKIYARQKEQPRVLWVRRAAWYHGSRGRMNSFHRKRTPLVDSLLKDVVLAYCMSTYVGIRKTAQHSLDQIASLYDGSRQLCVPTLIARVQPGVDDDQMKGALYVLGSKGFSSAAITDARFTAEYLLCLLNAQHHPKPSLQKLVRSLLGDFAARFVEPSTLKFDLETPAPLLEAVKSFTSPLPPVDEAMLQEVRDRRQARIARINDTHARLGPEIMRIGTNPATHWSFALYAARLLRAMIRRDRPMATDVATYFAGQLLSDNPNMRKYATGAITKILFFVKLRTLKDSDEGLVNGKTKNPLKRKEVVQTPASPEYQAEALSAFLGPMPADAVLVDKTPLGWLVWGGKQSVYSLPPADSPPWQWDEASQPALDAIWSQLSTSEWWEKHLGLWSQEKQREFTAQENAALMKSIAQVFGVRLVPVVGPIAEKLLGERDRHKHRAASEVMVGLVRGSKHWPLNDQAQLWAWITPLLPRIFKESTQDSQPVWEDFVMHTLDGRDPRRAKPLVDFVVDKAKRSLGGDDAEEDSPQMQTRGHALFRCALTVMDRKFTPRKQEFIDAYARAFDTAYTDIRASVGDILSYLELFDVAPSYASVTQFLAGEGQSSADASAHFEERFAKLRADLKQWRLERIPTSQGSSRYDCAAMTTLLWITFTLGDHRRSAMGSYAIDFLPLIFEMLELKDNTDLSKLARAALTKISTHHYGPGPLPGKLFRTLLDVITQSRDSWKVRLDGLTVLQVAFFQNLFYLGPSDVRSIVDVLLSLLRDAHPEVREMAATTLSGIVRCSERRLISDLKKRFTVTVQAASSALMPMRRGDAGFHEQLTLLHSGILGASALLSAFPYEVPAWMPSLLIETVTQHTDSPEPVSGTVKKCASSFKRTHQDNWAEVEMALSGEELNEVNQWVLGRSDYYA